MTIVKRIRRGAAARQKKQAASTTPNPPTTSATVGAGDGAEKTGPTPFTIPTANQLDLPAYTPIDNAVVVTSQPTSNTDPEKGRTGVVTTVTYPPNTYSAPNAHTSASDNPYTIYSPPGGPLTSPPPPFQRQPSY
ncbi:hypothetical protein CPB86DRAFT_786244 [Serendipita vermifera]|nr:hypothetical protein CPB86DRAFT_786244 [Serendipita vermifera]